MNIFQNVKVLCVSDKAIIGAKGFELVHLTGSKWEKYATLNDRKSELLSKCRIIQRLTRSEINRYYILNSGTEICIARKGIFRKTSKEENFSKCFNILRGSRPLNICEHEGRIYFGEYFQNINKEAVNVYGSEDDGRTWQVVYTFKECEIHHVHGIFKDPYTQSLWIVTGDGENECVIANTTDHFKSLNIVFRGSQQLRTCNLFFYKDFICFATDTELEQNYIKTFDRRTHEIKVIAEIQGTAIKGGQVGGISFLSTTVEPSKVNKDKCSHLWLTKNGVHWEDIYSVKKDWLPALFQFGSIEFPEYYINNKLNELWLSGRALSGIDGKSVVIEL